ncbi:lachesin [Caerostris darwini]|uniref:Lachesin n=1 Tax=Caerostris darwini TaxID=1538125 RepID=A0AAV4WDR5_9ARAC|nr:lachesin [Caerostris darwini]
MDKAWQIAMVLVVLYWNAEVLKNLLSITIIKADIVFPPDILDQGSSSDVVVREGANVTLTCKAGGYPTPNITWRREDNEPIPLGAWQGQKVTDPNAVTYEGEVLSITRVSRLHTGAYLCIAANGVPPSVSRRIILHVHFPPVLWIPNQLVGAAPGRDVTLDCHTEAYPTSINYWGRSATEMIISGDKMQVATKERAYKTHVRLTIRALQPADFGVYKCFSKNSLGSTEGSVRLYEIQPPTSQPTKDTSSIRRQSSEGCKSRNVNSVSELQSPQSVSPICVAAFPQHQSLGSVKDSTEDSTVSKWKRPIATVDSYTGDVLDINKHGLQHVKYKVTRHYSELLLKDIQEFGSNEQFLHFVRHNVIMFSGFVGDAGKLMAYPTNLAALPYLPYHNFSYIPVLAFAS